ncbi:MAG: hypothetical protein IJE08_05020 [Clostridia bacterium]|nr:hypothetical protein [Clostridia bacterium]
MMKKLIVLCLMICLAAGVISVPAQASDRVFSNLDDLLSYLAYDCAYMLADEISFGYTAALDDVFATPDALHYILTNCGMNDWTQKRNTTKRTVSIKDIEYFSGYKIAQAWEIEMTDLLLTSEEKEVLRTAQRIVDNVTMYSQSPYQTALDLHDELVRRVTYEKKPDPDTRTYLDTAVGALKYGRAECDGYADAYYLLCTLADIPAGYVCGYTGDESHLWNVIFFDGWWYQVDVTWDDLDVEGYDRMGTYRYFCVGSSMIENHRWDKEFSVHNQATYNNWDYFFYTYHPTGANGGAYYESLQDAANYAVHMQRNYSHESLHIMVEGNYDNAKRFNEILQNTGLRGEWTTWTYEMGEYTCFDIMFR